MRRSARYFTNGAILGLAAGIGFGMYATKSAYEGFIGRYSAEAERKQKNFITFDDFTVEYGEMNKGCAPTGSDYVHAGLGAIVKFGYVVMGEGGVKRISVKSDGIYIRTFGTLTPIECIEGRVEFPVDEIESDVGRVHDIEIEIESFRGDVISRKRPLKVIGPEPINSTQAKLQKM